MRRLVIIFGWWMLISCSSKSEQSGQETREFKIGEPFEVKDIVRATDYPSSERDTTICAGWTLTEEEIKDVIRVAEPITGPDWHHLFEHLPCVVSGQIIQDDLVYEFSINGGSWFVVTQGDTEVRYGDFHEKHSSLFLSSPDNGQTEN